MTLPSSLPNDACPSCEAASVRRERVRSDRPGPPIEAVFCSACGEWWFESGGLALDVETIRRLGLGDG